MLELFSTTTPDAVAMSLPAWLDLASVVVGAISGVFVARERRLDPVGFVGLAILCGLGGGLIRDMMMQTGGVYMLDSPYAIVAVVATALLAFFFPGPFDRFPALIEWVDIVSVGLFALMGTITGVGGGMLRDVFLGDVPRIFRPSNYYALCALAGAATYYLAVVGTSIEKLWGAALCVCVTVTLRRWSLRYNVLSPTDVNLGPRVAGRMRHLTKGTRIVRRSK